MHPTSRPSLSLHQCRLWRKGGEEWAVERVVAKHGPSGASFEFPGNQVVVPASTGSEGALVLRTAARVGASAPAVGPPPPPKPAAGSEIQPATAAPAAQPPQAKPAPDKGIGISSQGSGTAPLRDAPEAAAPAMEAAKYTIRVATADNVGAGADVFILFTGAHHCMKQGGDLCMLTRSSSDISFFLGIHR